MSETPHVYGVEITDAMLLALLSVGSYLVAYFYEAAYAYAFAVPLALINLRLTTIFSSLAAVLLGAGFVIGVNVALRLPSTRNHGFLFLALPSVIMASIVAMIFGVKRWQLLLYVLLLSIVLTVVLFGGLFMLLRNRKPDAGVRSPPLITEWFFEVCATAVFAMLFAVGFGYARAIDKTDFLVTAGPNPAAIVAIYGDVLIAAELDRKARVLVPNFLLLPVADTGRIWREERLGQMAPICDDRLVEDSAAFTAANPSIGTRAERLSGSSLYGDLLARCLSRRAKISSKDSEKIVGAGAKKP